MDVGLEQIADQDGVVGFGVIGLELLLVLEHPADGVALQDHAVDAVGVHVGDEIRIADLLALRAAGHIAAENRQHDQNNDDPEQDIFGQIIQLDFTMLRKQRRQHGALH
jgi:hypothetical protein